MAVVSKPFVDLHCLWEQDIDHLPHFQMDGWLSAGHLQEGCGTRINYSMIQMSCKPWRCRRASSLLHHQILIEMRMLSSSSYWNCSVSRSTWVEATMIAGHPLPSVRPPVYSPARWWMACWNEAGPAAYHVKNRALWASMCICDPSWGKGPIKTRKPCSRSKYVHMWS